MLLKHRYYLVTKRPYTQENEKVCFSLNGVGNVFELLHSLEESKWKKIKVDTHILNLPNKSGIYAIAITDTETGISEIAYIGSSTNLNRRFFSHSTLHFLRYGLHEKYKIEIYVAFYQKGYRGLEHDAIRLFKPFLNKEKEKKVFIEYNFNKRGRR